MLNILYYGGNLDILRQHATDESVELLYPDPLTFTISEMPGGRRSALRALPPSYHAVQRVRGARGHQPSMGWANG